MNLKHPVYNQDNEKRMMILAENVRHAGRMLKCLPGKGIPGTPPISDESKN